MSAGSGIDVASAAGDGNADAARKLRRATAWYRRIPYIVKELRGVLRGARPWQEIDRRRGPESQTCWRTLSTKKESAVDILIHHCTFDN